MEFSFLNGQAFEKTKRLQDDFILKCPTLLLLLFFSFHTQWVSQGKIKKRFPSALGSVKQA